MQVSLELALEPKLDHDPPLELELEELLELPQPELELEELLELDHEPPHEPLELELELEEPPQRSSTSRGALKLGWLARFLQELA